MRIFLTLLLGSALALAAACASKPPSPLTEPIRQAFIAADKDGDEALSPDEFATLPFTGVKFADLDTDGNGKITLAELRSYLIWRRVQAEDLRRSDSAPRPRY